MNIINFPGKDIKKSILERIKKEKEGKENER